MPSASLIPHDPTVHAMFDPDHVESYRQLGLMIGLRLSQPLAELVGGAIPQRCQALTKLLAQSVSRKSAAPELPDAVVQVLTGTTRVRGGYTIGPDEAKLTPPFDTAVYNEPPAKKHSSDPSA